MALAGKRPIGPVRFRFTKSAARRRYLGAHFFCKMVITGRINFVDKRSI